MSNPLDVMASSDNETTLRKQIFGFQSSEAEGPYQGSLTKLNLAWSKFNDLYFGGELTPAFIEVTQTHSTKALGSFSVWSGYGGRYQIKIREKIIDGTYKRFNPNHSIENRWKFILDILLHEQIHQFVHVILDDHSKGFGGHGDNFTTKANQIGDILGLPQVEKRRRKDKSIPISSQWPINIRPADYYGDLLKVTEEDEDEPAGDTDDDDPVKVINEILELAINSFKRLTQEEREKFFDATGLMFKPVTASGDTE